MKDDFNRVLGQRIRNLRTNRGLSMLKLAEMAKMSEKHLGKIERGDVNASIQSIASLAQALDMPVRTVLEAEHEMSKEELQNELLAAIPTLTAKDMGIIYRLIQAMTGR